MNAVRLVVTLLVVSAVAACGVLEGIKAPETVPEGESSQPPPGASIPEPEQEASSATPVSRSLKSLEDLDSLLGYFQQIKKLSGPELVRAHEEARRSYTATRTEYDRMRLAMLLSLPNTSFRNETQALELLDPTIRNHTKGLYGLAFLLTSNIQERKKLDGNIQSLQQNVQDLQHKLDALKSLERSMSQREQSGAKKR